MPRTQILPVLVLLAALAPAAAPAASRTPRLEAMLEQSPHESHLVWVFFADRGSDPEGRLAQVGSALTKRAIARRSLRAGRGVELRDLAPVDAYIAAVTSRVSRVRHVSRWFNAMSVEATAAQVASLDELAFVARLDRVAVFEKVADPESARALAAPTTPQAGSSADFLLDYGIALNQVEMLGVPTVHDRGINGEGVLVAVFDTGFDDLDHAVFAQTNVVATRDFVNGDEDVATGDDRGDGSHGRSVLSVVGGFLEGTMIGTAYGADYIVAKTEDTTSETSVEEDNWAAAAEWAEAMGADVITSSLGYRTFDDGSGYTLAELDGETAISTIAADRAADLGVVVLTSAGNEGLPLDPADSTIIAPTDGNKVLSVGGVSPGGERVGFSSVGPTGDGRIKPDVAAQATQVIALSPGFDGDFRGVAGTSFACPLTAGVAALVLQAHPEYTVDQVIAVLRSTASQASEPDNLLGWGIVNAVAAIEAEAPTLPE